MDVKSIFTACGWKAQSSDHPSGRPNVFAEFQAMMKQFWLSLCTGGKSDP